MTVRDLTKSTVRSTVEISRKTKSTLKSTLRLTLQFLGRRGYRPRNRLGRGLDMTVSIPQSGTQKFLPDVSIPSSPAGVPAGNGAAFAAAAAGFADPTRRTFEPVIAGSQIIRLATASDELDAAQALRYRVFYDEMGARPLPEMAATRRDFDRYDATCDHLIVVDQERPREAQVVGTYRLMRDEHARAAGGFYSASEYDITNLMNFPGTVMELGRSCVDAAYRNRATLNLLWRGIAEYLNAHDVDLMFGCASLPGTDPERLATQLSYLYHYHLAPEALRPRALPHRFAKMDLLPKAAIDPVRTLASLPPLLKGYLRVGAFVGDGAVVDHQFNTTDVCVVARTDMIAERYTRHFDLAERPGPTSFKRAS